MDAGDAACGERQTPGVRSEQRVRAARPCMFFIMLSFAQIDSEGLTYCAMGTRVYASQDTALSNKGTVASAGVLLGMQVLGC